MLELVTERREVGQVWVLQSKKNKGLPGAGTEGHSALGLLVEGISYVGFRITSDLSDEAADYRLFCADANGELKARGLVWKITTHSAKSEKPVTTLYLRIEDSRPEAEVVATAETETKATAETGDDNTAEAEDVDAVKSVDQEAVAIAGAVGEFGAEAVGDFAESGAGDGETAEKDDDNTAEAEDADAVKSGSHEAVETAGAVGEFSAESVGDSAEADAAASAGVYRYYVTVEKEMVSRSKPGAGMIRSRFPAFGVYRRRFTEPEASAEAGADPDTGGAEPEAGSADPAVQRVKRRTGKHGAGDAVASGGKVQSGNKSNSLGVDESDEDIAGSLKKVTSMFKYTADR